MTVIGVEGKHAYTPSDLLCTGVSTHNLALMSVTNDIVLSQSSEREPQYNLFIELCAVMSSSKSVIGIIFAHTNSH